MDYNFPDIEKKWQKYWEENKTYRTETDPSKPKFFVLVPMSADFLLFKYPYGIFVFHSL